MPGGQVGGELLALVDEEGHAQETVTGTLIFASWFQASAELAPASSGATLRSTTAFIASARSRAAR